MSDAPRIPPALSPMDAATFLNSIAPDEQLAAKRLVFTPDMNAITRSQWAAFAASFGASLRRDLSQTSQLHAASVSCFRDFWAHVLEWSRLQYQGDAARVCLGDMPEAAVFFPDIKLNYAENLLSADAGRSDAPAIVSRSADGSRRALSRGELNSSVERLAQSLRMRGVRAGDTAVAILRNDVQAVIATLALAALGVRLAIAAPELGAQAMIARFKPMAPRLLLAHVGPMPHDTGLPVASRVAQAMGALPSLDLTVALDDGSAHLPAGASARLNLSDLLRLPSSGLDAGFEWTRFPFSQPLFVTTGPGPQGLSEGVIHGAGGVLLEHVKEHRLHLDVRACDTLFMQTACSWMMWPWQLSALASGACIVLYDGPLDDASTLWRIVQDEHVTVFGTSPPYFRLCQHVSLVPGQQFDLSALRAIITTGPKLYEPTYHWVKAQVKEVSLQALCGSPDILGCFALGNPTLPVHAGESQSLSLGLDVRAAGGVDSSIGELVCANPFPSRPLGFVGDLDGTRFHQTFFARHAGAWADGELIELTAEGGTRLHGRADGVMNVRGIRVGPAEVYDVVREFDEVSEAMVVEQKSPSAFSEGRAVLLLVLKTDIALDGTLSARLRRRLAEAASAAHVPEVILQVQALPRTQDGAVSYAAMSDAVNGVPVRDRDLLQNPECLDAVREAPALRGPDLLLTQVPVPPAPGWRSRRDHEVYLSRLWERTFGFAPIGPNDDFFELGGHSLLAARMFADIQQATGQKLTLSTLLQAPTVRQLAGVIDAASWNLPVPLVQLRAGTGRPFFMVHSLAGYFLEMWAVLREMEGVTRPIYGLQARGLGGEQEPQTRVADMAADYIRRMRRVQPVGPYSIGGYSLGGLIAYEIAQQLRSQGETVDLLALIDSHFHGRYLRGYQQLQYRGNRVIETVSRFWEVKSGERGEYARKKLLAVVDRVRGRLKLPPKWPHLVGDVVGEANLPPAMRRVRGAMLIALRDYRPEIYPGKAIFLRAEIGVQLDPLPLWRELVQGGLHVDMTPGDHYDMLTGDNAKALAQALGRYL